MSNYSGMSGLDLFTDPFSRTQAYNQPPVRSSSTVAPRPNTAATQTSLDRQAKPVTAKAQQTSNVPEKPVTPIAAPSSQENVKAPVPEPVATEPAPAQEQKPTATEPAPAKESTPAATQSEPPKPSKKALELDMSTSAGTSGKVSDEDDVARRKAHEEAEAKRRELWESKVAEKRKAEEEALQKLNSMSDDDVIAASVERISTEVERITRRSMKEAVSLYIQDLARKDSCFARKVLNERKNLVMCFRYINKRAKEYVMQEMQDNDIKPDGNGYGTDVPEGLCFQWATEYFYEEEKVEEEKFIPKPYVGKTSKSKKTATKAKKTEKSTAKDTAKNQDPKDNFEQMSLFEKEGAGQ